MRLPCGLHVKMRRVVLDTNAFIDAIFRNETHAQQVLRMASRGEITLVVSDGTELELMKTAVYLFINGGLSFADAKAALLKTMSYAQKAERVVAPAIFAGCEDPSDNKFFDCAVAGKADCIISRDCHINGAAGPPVQVFSAWQFLQNHALRQR